MPLTIQDYTEHKTHVTELQFVTAQKLEPDIEVSCVTGK